MTGMRSGGEGRASGAVQLWDVGIARGRVAGTGQRKAQRRAGGAQHSKTDVADQDRTCNPLPPDGETVRATVRGKTGNPGFWSPGGGG